MPERFGIIQGFAFWISLDAAPCSLDHEIRFQSQAERSVDGGDGVDVESSLQDTDHRVVVAGQQHSVVALNPVDRRLTFRQDDHVIDDVEVLDEQAGILVKNKGVVSFAVLEPIFVRRT